MHLMCKTTGQEKRLGTTGEMALSRVSSGGEGLRPAGVPVGRLEKVRLAFDELEALRLLHLEGITQAEAGRRLGVSRSTVSRMAERAHRSYHRGSGPRQSGLCRGRAGDGGADRQESRRIAGGGSTTTNTNSVNEGERMVIAVPYLEGNVNAHFGSTQAFLVAEAVDGKVERTSIFEVQGMQHNHSGIAGFLKDQGVEIILAGGMGAPMQQALKLQGFGLYCGVSGPAVEAVDAYLRGEIEHSESTCGHHHGE